MVNKLFASLMVAAFLALAVSPQANADIVLFADSFDDELGGGVNATPNSSVSGLFAQANANNYTGRGDGNFVESGGQLTWSSPDADSALLVPLWNFATSTAVQQFGELTIEITDLVPSTADWFALSVMNTIPNTITSYVNRDTTTVGALFRSNGTVSTFELGAGQGAASENWTSGNIRFELRNITNLGTEFASFDYEIFSGDTSLVASSMSGVNLANIFIGLESRDTTASSISSFSVTAVPEPATASMLCTMLAATLLRRRR